MNSNLSLNWDFKSRLNFEGKPFYFIFERQIMHVLCCNPSFGFTIKVRACKSVGQEGSPGVTFHAPGSAKECEGLNLHTPKGILILGVGVPVIF